MIRSADRPLLMRYINHYEVGNEEQNTTMDWCVDMLKGLPPTQPTLYGYNIEHLELIARVLQKENLPPERVAEALTDISRIVAIIKDEFEETLRRTVQNIEMQF